MSEERVEFDRLLTDALLQLDFALDAGQRALLYRHYLLLKQWNEKMSLTSIRGLSETVFRHFGESLAVAKVVGSEVRSVLDIGSGPGFPGIPVAVSWPRCDVILVESSGKKATFLQEVARLVRNVRVQHGRLEVFQGLVDCATMRAVPAASVAEHITRVASRVVVLTSAERAAVIGEVCRLQRQEQREVPWDRRTVVLSGHVSRETGTSIG